ncbi:MAG: hypothetical protein ABS79_07695 [Planctomycetes bacterium SCN 63-9]|nr:MAG: hypothetical protein ABS79_07695 [Planctomycetes bacterium SCN 63-9]
MELYGKETVMRRFGLSIALLALFAGLGLVAVGCNWTETRRDFPPNALASPHHGHGHDHP